MEQPRQAFIQVNLQQCTVGSLWLLAKMQQQPVELQLNKQPRKLFFSQRVNFEVVTCYFYDV